MVVGFFNPDEGGRFGGGVFVDDPNACPSGARGCDAYITLLLFKICNVALYDSSGVATWGDADDETFVLEGLGLVAFVGWILREGFAFLAENIFYIVQGSGFAALGMTVKGDDFHRYIVF